MTLKLILAGQFMMGSTKAENQADSRPERIRTEDEVPLHRVRITNPAFLGVRKVTQPQWEAVMDTSAKSMCVGCPCCWRRIAARTLLQTINRRYNVRLEWNQGTVEGQKS